MQITEQGNRKQRAVALGVTLLALALLALTIVLKTITAV
jgi:hypothetical protein